MSGGIGALDVTVMCGYFVIVIAVGVFAGQFTRTTSEYFFAGQRFSWWLVAVSCVATLVGSYSFQSYSQVGYLYGFASLMPYMNEWFVLPIFLVAWLPIIYYSRVQSIPEYFELRFDRRTRTAVLIILLIYLEVYIGINLLTIGQVLLGVFRPYAPFATDDLNILLAAAMMALIAGIYLHHGGQTSVLMTDLVQGLLLLGVGLAVFGFGVVFLGGFGRFWQGLPPDHRVPLPQFNRPPGLHEAGDFWNDAIIGTFAFYCINQGVLMRFLSVKSVRDGRKAMLFTVLILMPLAAISVSGAGWIGRSMETHGMLQHDAATLALKTSDAALFHKTVADQIFVNVARHVLSWPGMFGLVMAAVVAALMSTLDTLITAVSAVAVNDIWREWRPGREDAYYLRAARLTAIVATVVGLGMIPVGTHFETIYQALSMFTSLVIPPLAVVIFLAVTTHHFTARPAFWTLVLGSAAMVVSLVWPQLIRPLSHGVDPSGGFPYLRSLYGLIVSLTIAAWLWGVDRRVRQISKTAARASIVGGVLAIVGGVVWLTVALQPSGGSDDALTIGSLWSGVSAFQHGWAIGLMFVLGATALVSGRIVLEGPRTHESVDGLVMGTIDHARQMFKGAKPSDRGVGKSIVLPLVVTEGTSTEVRLSSEVMQHLEADPGDQIYISDARWWLGGFRSFHAKAGRPAETDGQLCLSQALVELGHLLPDRAVRVEKVM